MGEKEQKPTDWATRIVSHLNHRHKAESWETEVEQDAYLTRLREYASTWMQSGFSLDHWRMREVLQKDVREMTVFLLSRPDGQPYVMTVWGHLDEPEPVSSADFVPTDTEEAAPTDPADLEHSGQLRASEAFLKFIIGPYYDRIGQCARCVKWFLNSSGKKTRYCSLTCSKLDTSNEAKKATRQRQTLNKIQRIEDAIKAFNRLPKTKRRAIALRPDGWKGWLEKKAAHGVTTNFITRLLNAKRIEPPNDV